MRGYYSEKPRSFKINLVTKQQLFLIKYNQQLDYKKNPNKNLNKNRNKNKRKLISIAKFK